MDILCLMGLFPKEYEENIINDSIRSVQNAANKLQWAIVNGLMQQDDVNLKVLNSLYIGSYPKRYKKLYIPSFAFSVNGQSCGYNVGFFNLSAVKIISRYLTMKKKIKEWAEQPSGQEKVVIAYAMTSPMVELLHYVKRNYPGIKCILVVPDLPEYMSFTRGSVLRRMAKSWNIVQLKKRTTILDGFVLLTDQMKEWFETEIRYTVVEGMYSGTNDVTENGAREKIILYAGGLSKEYGILDLTEAFMAIKKPEWKLVLIGDGSFRNELEVLAEKDSRIILTGTLPNSRVVEMQRKASILVNPRKGNQVFTKYSFPSKTIEYMVSGTPMVGYKLEGIPDEYFKFISEIAPEEDGLKECLEKLMNLSDEERNRIGQEAKRFILEKKNAKSQCYKIIELIKKL